MTAEQRILAWLEKADFTGTGCRHSQDTIAKATGCTRRTVIRAVQSLAADGRITVAKERRPGCKWLCNVYRVKAWNPQKRAGVLNVLAGIREAHQTQCHTERTATASRAHTTPQDPSSPRSVCGCARGTHPISARRGYVCNDCRTLAEQNAAQAEELSGALHTIRKLGAENSRLRGQTIHAGDDLKTANVWVILENWLWLCRGRKRGDKRGRLPLIDPGSKRWTIAAKAEKREPEGVRACVEAVEGLACKPFVTNHGRSPQGRPSQRYDDIEYALKDETAVERCRKYRAEVLGATEGVLFAAWQQLAATEGLYWSLWQDRVARARFDAMPEYKQIAHRMRVAEAADAAETARVIDLHSRRDVA